MLCVKVGTITSIERHPQAENLYVEQIDTGEAAPRQVISGLVKHVPQGAMEGRRVAVACNLKPAKMREVMSHGMVRDLHSFYCIVLVRRCRHYVWLGACVFVEFTTMCRGYPVQRHGSVLRCCLSHQLDVTHSGNHS